MENQTELGSLLSIRMAYKQSHMHGAKVVSLGWFHENNNCYGMTKTKRSNFSKAHEMR